MQTTENKENIAAVGQENQKTTPTTDLKPAATTGSEEKIATGSSTAPKASKEDCLIVVGD